MIVLVVDDHELIRSLVSVLLTREGFRLLEAADGIDGYEILQQVGSRVDLLLTDIQMPRMDGISLAQRARQLYPNLPIVFMTGDLTSASQLPARSVVLEKQMLDRELIPAIVKGMAEVAEANLAHFNPPQLGSAKPGPPADSHQLLLTQSWLQQMRRARTHYNRCAARFHSVVEEQNRRLLPAPDGRDAVRQARKEEAFALKEYVRVLGILTDLAVSAKLPEGEPPEPDASVRGGGGETG